MTLGKIAKEYMGFLSVLYNPTLEGVCIRKGPLAYGFIYAEPLTQGYSLGLIEILISYFHLMQGRKREDSIISKIYVIGTILLVVFTLLFFGAVFTGLWYF